MITQRRYNYKLKNFIFIFIVSFVLTACGFKQVYSTKNHKVISVLKNMEIEVNHISSVESTDFYNHIKSLMPPLSSQPIYQLNITLSYSKECGMIQKNSDITRESEFLKVSYIFIEISTQKQIISGTFTKVSSFNTSFLPYANISLEQESRKNLAQVAAEELHNRLVLFLENNRK